MSNGTTTKTHLLILIKVFVVIIVIYFIVFPTLLFFVPPKDESISIINKLKSLHIAISMYKLDWGENYFPTTGDLKLYGGLKLFDNDDITLNGKSALSAGQKDEIIAVSRIMKNVPSPYSYGCVTEIRGWPSTSIPERRIQLYASGKIIICPIKD